MVGYGVKSKGYGAQGMCVQSLGLRPSGTGTGRGYEDVADVSVGYEDASVGYEDLRVGCWA